MRSTILYYTTLHYTILIKYNIIRRGASGTTGGCACKASARRRRAHCGSSWRRTTLHYDILIYIYIYIYIIIILLYCHILHYAILTYTNLY